MKKKCVIVVMLACCVVCKAQISTVQSSDGETSLVTQGGLNINFNFEDSKVSGSGYIPENRNWDLLYQASFKAVDGVSKIFTENKFSPQATVGLNSVFYFPQDEKKGDALGILYFSANQTFADHKLLDSLSNFDNVISKKNEFNTKFVFGYNRDSQKGFIFGLALQGNVSSNNYDDLDDYTITTGWWKYNSDSSQVKLISNDTQEIKGKNDEYHSNFFEGQVLLDILYWPKDLVDQLAIGGHFRANYREISKPAVTAAIGFYLTKASADTDEENDPTAIVGGIILGTSDLFGRRTEDSFLERCTINLVMGYTFGKK